MARLVLGVAGAVAGSAFFGPTGAQWGWMAGSLVGGLLTTSKRRVTIDESGNQTTQEGAPRAIIFGTGIATGNIFYGFPARKIETEQGGKGGGPTATSVQYLRTYAIRICEGPVAGVLMVKQDGEIVYDARPNSVLSDEDNAAFLARCTIYLGGEDQLPDPDLEAIKGVGEVPAHRGTAYIVFADDDLTARGGTVPQYEFVVANSLLVVDSGLVVGPVLASPTTYLTLDDQGLPCAITGRAPQAPGAPDDTLDPGAQLTLTHWRSDWSQRSTSAWVNAGDSPGSQTLWVFAADHLGRALAFDANFGSLKLVQNGTYAGSFKPAADASPAWYYDEPGANGVADRRGGLVWIDDGSVYVGLRRTQAGTFNRVCRWPLGGGIDVLPSATILGVNPDPGAGSDFAIHLSRAGKLRTLNAQGLKRYSSALAFEGDEPMPPLPGGAVPLAFGVDETFGVLTVVSIDGVRSRVTTYRMPSLAVVSDHVIDVGWSYRSRVVFGRAGAYVQIGLRLFRIGLSANNSLPQPLASIVADIHARCGHAPGDYDVSALEGIDVAGLVLASQGYTGADAIDTLRTPYFFDRAEYDGRIHYVPRGAPVVASLTLDDLVEAPDESTRSDPITYPRKLHLKYQSEAVQWEVTQVTSERVTPDVRVVGEESTEVPVVLTAEQAQTIVAKLHKVSWADADGEVKFSVPSRWLRLVRGDCIGLTLRGKTRRLRIVQTDDADGVRDLTCRIDRQSAYSAVVTVIPVPEPSPTVGRYPGETVLAVLDIPALTDAQDVLGYYVAGSGARAAWRGYQAQRSTDGGASFAEAATSTSTAVVGTLLDAVPAASPWYTDTTNAVRVQLVRQTQELAGLTDAVFMQRGGAFALQAADGSWEVLQYRDAVGEGDGIYALTHLHRGQLATAPAAHAAGARFVLLSTALPVAASSAWLGLDLVHRGVSLGLAPDGVPTQSRVYTGQQQREWPVASLAASITGGTLRATWAGRHRFGTDVAPVASVNFQGFRVSVADAETQLAVDTTAEAVELDVSALALPITVAVSALNRITGPGPATSKVITA